ncbi:hypothetical protein ACOMHN_000510 [Nucella lapillus]
MKSSLCMSASCFWRLAPRLELEIDSITEILSKERKEGAEKVTSQEEATRELKKTIEAMTDKLESTKVECLDYKRILEQEKVKAKAQTSTTDEKINVLETQLLQVQCSMKTALKQLEEETKERVVMEEKLVVSCW